MLTEIERQQYLIGNIPYRLQSLQTCRTLCHMKMSQPTFGLELRMGEMLVLDDANALLTNPIVESGLIYCRVLLEFLGIGLVRTTGMLKQTQTQKNMMNIGDICITDFNLPKITVGQATTGFAYASADRIDTALRQVILNANKSVAHLTSGPTLPATLPDLRLSCHVVVDLIISHLYIPLGQECIVAVFKELFQSPE